MAPIPMNSADKVVINEWLATSRVVYGNDFLELYNPGTLPVELSGMMISDDPNNRPDRHVVAPLSFIDAGGFVEFIADGDLSEGSNHLGFRLSKLMDQVAISVNQVLSWIGSSFSTLLRILLWEGRRTAVSRLPHLFLPHPVFQIV